MSKDKTRLLMIAIGTLLLLATTALYALMMASKEKINPGNLIPFIIPLMIVVFMAFFVSRRFKDIKQGMPFEDERSKRVVTQAAAKTFYVSLYWLLAISWFESFFAQKLFGAEKLDASQTVGGGIAGMALLFFGFWFYYESKGKLE